jgi:hypothetical protein
MTADDFDELPFEYQEENPPTFAGPVTERKCRRHQWRNVPYDGDYEDICRHCGKIRDLVLSRRGKQSRNYGNRAELAVARTYGGDKIGQAGGPVDVRGKDWNVQVKTHRRLPPAEWRKAFSAMAASNERLPRLLLRFLPGPGLPPDDYFVVPAKAWLDFHGRDE